MNRKTQTQNFNIVQEEKERAFEKDFERFCPHFVRDSDIEDDSQRITVKNLMDVFEVHSGMMSSSSGQYIWLPMCMCARDAQDLDVPLTADVAEEMIYDADLSKLEGRVSYDDLIATITIITSKEVRARVHYPSE